MSDVVTCECGRQWTGLAECHCVSCHRHFAGDLAFQAHVVGDICRDPTSLKDRKGRPRFVAVYRKDGVVWKRADYRSPDRDFGARRQAPRTVAATRHHRIVSNATLTRRAPRRRSVA